MPRRSLDDPWIKNKYKNKTSFVSHKNSYKNHCFVMNEYLEHESSRGTYLEMKISIRAFDSLNITSTALLGCSFVTQQDPKSMFHHKRSFET